MRSPLLRKNLQVWKCVKRVPNIETTIFYATYLKWIPGTGLFKQLIDQAKAMFKDIDNTNDLTFLRLRTKKHEIMVAPEKDYLLIVVQETTDI